MKMLLTQIEGRRMKKKSCLGKIGWGSTNKVGMMMKKVQEEGILPWMMMILKKVMTGSMKKFLLMMMKLWVMIQRNEMIWPLRFLHLQKSSRMKMMKMKVKRGRELRVG